ncbi:MAG: type 4a pilus biogenesis protein PilO [Candidatus Colwellbacteria bacterium]|nr:type 4a pilus biogenesis protein PilO [Candidatus Colwellbacteria bacterium]
MKASTKRFYSLLLSLGLLFGVLFIFSSLIQPEYAEVQRIRGEREAKTKLLEDFRATADALNQLLEKYQNISELQAALSLSLPIGEKVPDIFNQIQGMAKLSDARIDSISFQYLGVDYGDKSAILRPLGSLRAAVKLSGSYDSLKKFLGAVETNIRILDVSTIALDGGALSRNPVLNYTVSLDTRYQSIRQAQD